MRISALLLSLSLSIVLPACGTDWSKSDCLTGRYDDLGNCLHVICADGEPSYDGDCDGDGYTAWEDCDDNNPDPSICIDGDGDGFTPHDGDCDDANASTHIGASEWCDGFDNDCDGAVDEGVLTEWFADTDGDGSGDATQVLEACSQPAGFVLSPSDCDDTDAEVNGSAVEVCDGIDNDCDGDVDDADSDLEGGDTLWFEDADGDSYGNPDVSARSCFAPDGYVADDNDCDDSNSEIHPNADEVCDADDVDEDCDGLVDDADPNVELDSTSTWYIDLDSDGYGHPSATIDACDPPSNYVQNFTDCDDGDPGVNPGAREVCDGDGVDENCDGIADEQTTWYADNDTDGYGDPAVTIEDCDQPSGYIANDKDCDDGDVSINPGATEVCDADDVDEDCDGDVDDADASVTGTSTYYTDSDGDGYGDLSSPVNVCDPASDQVTNSTDCNDSNASVHPGAVEVCDSSDTDDDCDGLADDADASVDTGTYVTFYLDGDADGYGDISSTTQQCDVPSGYVGNYSDCNDADATISPAATEVCDSADVDEDCDGAADDADSSVDTTTYNDFFADTDGDGYGDAFSTTGACDQPSGFVVNASDCNDADATISPAATEVCDSADVDEDCDGAADDADSSVDISTFQPFYADDDLDGYGDASSSTTTCDEPSGYVTDDTDCDDTNGDINPAATEICDADDVDEDCDGAADDSDSSTDTSTMTDWYPDSDSDGYGDSSASATSQCESPSGYVTDNTDCDDTDDEVGSGDWYPDQDEDGFGDDSASVSFTCTDPSDSGGCEDRDTSTLCYAAVDNTDCDDSDADVNPDGYELFWDWTTATEYGSCTDTKDNDCNGLTDVADTEPCSDIDGDGEYDGAQQIFACDPTSYGQDYAVCVVGGFSGVWLGEDSYYSDEPFTSIITSGGGKTPTTAQWGGRTYTDVNWISGGPGGYSGTYFRTMVSDLAADGVSTVNPSDTTTWQYLDLSGYCAYTTSSYCILTSYLASGYAFTYDWDGAGTTREVSAP